MIEAKYTLTGEVNVATSIEYIQPNLEEGKVTPTKEEQIIKPSEEYNGFSQVTIDPIPNEYIIPSGNLDIEANGDYDVTVNSSVKVNVNPTLQDKSISVKPNDNIKVIADEEYDGLREVNVVGTIDLENVEVTPTKEVQTINRSEDKYIESVTINPIPDNYIEPTGELDIIENGQYDVTDKASVNVNIETGGGGDTNEYIDFSLITNGKSSGTSNIGSWINCVKKIVIKDKTFTSCQYLFSGFLGDEIELINVNTSSVTNANSMFRQCSLTSLNLNGLDMSNVTTMTYFCYSNKSLLNIYVNNLNVSKVTNVSYAFNYCSKLQELDLSNWDFAPTNVSYFVNNCSMLKKLDIRKMDFSNVTAQYTNAFTNIPNDCLIIVKDDTQKTWITEKFTNLTNVKTVAEL